MSQIAANWQVWCDSHDVQKQNHWHISVGTWNIQTLTVICIDNKPERRTSVIDWEEEEIGIILGRKFFSSL